MLSGNDCNRVNPAMLGNNKESDMKTYYESGKFYAVITLPNGQTYYKGAYNSRSTARRVAIREQAKHKHAASNGMIYNVKIGA